MLVWTPDHLGGNGRVKKLFYTIPHAKGKSLILSMLPIHVIKVKPYVTVLT